MMDYTQFIRGRSQFCNATGFTTDSLPTWLKPFQASTTEWALRQGRALISADCGLGKTPMQLVWADQVLRKTGKRVLVATPLAVSSQTIRESEKFGIESEKSQDGKYAAGIVVTNYERLHYFNPDDFIGMVCDEASILKAYSGSTRKRITRFMSKMPYRLLCTATAAPNDYVELGTCSEALGELSHSDMLRRFFKMLDDKGQKSEQRQQEQAEALIKADNKYYGKLAFRVAQTISQWRLKHHAVTHFWRWVASWARAFRLPSDLGFSDDGYKLPQLSEVDHVMKPAKPAPGMLFDMPAFGRHEELEERRRTLNQRCEYVGNLVDHDDAAVIWCQLNDEGDLLEEIIEGSRQIWSGTSDEEREELYDAFTTGQLKKLIIKPKIGAWGMNWQHCNHSVTFPSHSYEQRYQSIRRFYRFGQERPVKFDTVATTGEVRVMENLKTKGMKADAMFTALVAEMRAATKIDRKDDYTKAMEVPSWL